MRPQIVSAKVNIDWRKTFVKWHQRMSLEMWEYHGIAYDPIDIHYKGKHYEVRGDDAHVLRALVAMEAPLHVVEEKFKSFETQRLKFVDGSERDKP